MINVQVSTISRLYLLQPKKSMHPQQLYTYTQHIAVAPQIAPFEITEKPANSGDSISVVCAIVKGDLPMEITWSVDGVPVGERSTPTSTFSRRRKRTVF